MGGWERRKLRASGSQCGFSVWRNNGGQERTCKGKSDVRATWDFSRCDVDVSVDSTARCRGLDVTFSHDTVTPLGFCSKFYMFRLCRAHEQIGVRFIHAVDTPVSFPNIAQFISFVQVKK